MVVLGQSVGNALFIQKTENQDFEMAPINAENKELLQMWYHVDGCAQPPCS